MSRPRTINPIISYNSSGNNAVTALRLLYILKCVIKPLRAAIVNSCSDDRLSLRRERDFIACSIGAVSREVFHKTS